MKKFWQFVQSSWKTRALFMFVFLWFWFAMMTAFAPLLHPLYTDDMTGRLVFAVSEINFYLYMLGIVLGIIFYLVGIIWVLKACTKNYEPGAHWIDIMIKRVLYGFCFIVMSAVAIASVFFAIDIWPFSAIVFSVICFVSLIIGFIVSGRFMKQSLITEANVRAKEVYNGKKRFSRHYGNNKK